MIDDVVPGKTGVNHWARFRRLLRGVALTGAALATAALGYVWTPGAPIRWPMLVAVGAGVFLTVLLTGTLMGLVFVSHRSGHDEAVADAEQEL